MVAVRKPAVTIPHLVQPAVIPGLPKHLQTVPEAPDDWAAWRDAVMAHRELVRRRAADNLQLQRIELEKCARDPAYWITMYGVIFEPRDQEIGGVVVGWVRWIPYAFQVKLIRWIDDVLKETANGRGDGVIEKSRDMGATWTFCGFMAAKWLTARAFVAGLISRNEEAVEKKGDTDSLFYKVRALLGCEQGVPPEIILPKWMWPKGFDPEEHIANRIISHPTRTCVIRGETTTQLSGVGGRATMRVNDEAARFRAFGQAWGNQNATANHRFALSSADLRFGPDFHDLAKMAEAAVLDPSLPGPSYMRLDWWIHPFHTQAWYVDQKARMASDPATFAREYDIDYDAGKGEAVYPFFQQVVPTTAPYDPVLGQLYCFIDPGVRDPTALVWVQHDARADEFRVVEAFEGKGGEAADFYASVVSGVPISGHGGYDYRSYPGLLDLMAWTGSLTQPVIYFGDPYGTHRGGDGSRTWYDVFYERTRDLTGGHGGVNVRTVTSEDARSHLVRKEAVLKYAPKLRFDDTPRVRRVLLALQRSRYPEAPVTRSSRAEPLTPLHDEHSHFRTAMEFGFVNLERIQMWSARPKPKHAPRRTMNGTLIRT